MSASPQITTIIPTYRRPKQLARAIQSVLGQTYPHFQLCIYDNASGDETESVVRGFMEKDARVHYHRHETNMGSNANFQYGLERVHTPYFSFLSDDDFVLPTFFDTTLEGFVRFPEIGFCGGATQIISEDGSLRNITPRFSGERYFLPPQGVMEFVDGAIPLWTSIVFKHSIIEKVGYLNVTSTAVDLDFFARVAICYPYFIKAVPCAVFVKHQNSISMQRSFEICLSTLEIAERIKDHHAMPAELKELFLKEIRCRVARQILALAQRSIKEKNLADMRRAAAILGLHFHQRGLSTLLFCIAKCCELPGAFFAIRLFNGWLKVLYRFFITRIHCKSSLLRIGVDVSPLVSLQGGISYYVYYLLDELIRQQPHCQFYLYSPTLEGGVAHFKIYANVTLRRAPNFLKKNALWRNVNLPVYLRRDKIDVYWQTMMIFPWTLPKKIKVLLTVYDFVAFLFPETMSPLNATYYQKITYRSLKRADYLLPISQGTGKRLKEMFNVNYEEVIHPPLKPEMIYRGYQELSPFLCEKKLQYNRYLITVGTWEPRKNFCLLTRIYCRALEQYGPDKVVPLVIIGGGGWKNEEIQRDFRRAQDRYPTHFRVTGYISDTELSFYLSGARFYIALSLYEGYGMPIAESRLCRTPVICRDEPEMREAAEEDGIFLKTDELEIELCKYMLIDQENEQEKRPLRLGYSTTEKSARKLSTLLEKISNS